MPVTDNRTTHRNYPLPASDNWLSEDVIRLRMALQGADADIQDALDAVAGRALTAHAHTIADITGLADDLAAKAANDHLHALAALIDVDVSIITVGQYLRWDGAKWVPGVVSADDIKAGTIDPARLPSIAITDTYVVTSQAGMLALSVQKGDIAVRQDLNRSFILSGSNPALLASWTELLTPTDAVLSVAGLTGAIPADALRDALAAIRHDAAQTLTSAQKTQLQTNAGGTTVGRAVFAAANAGDARTAIGIGTATAAGSALGIVSAGSVSVGNYVDVRTANGQTWRHLYGATSKPPSGTSGLTVVYGFSFLDVPTAVVSNGNGAAVADLILSALNFSNGQFQVGSRGSDGAEFFGAYQVNFSVLGRIA